MDDLKFGFTLATHSSYAALADTCRTADAYGYDIALAVDHLGPGRTSPFQALLAASRASDNLLLGTYVLNLGFWNAAMLARDIASIIRLGGPRFELGVGAGIIKSEFDAAGIPFAGFGARMDYVASVIDQIEELLTVEEGVDMPPVMIGGTGDQALRLAAARADIVSFGGLLHVPGHELGTFRMPTAAETGERVAFFTAAAGDRGVDIERNCFVQVVRVTDDRRKACADIADDWRASEDAPHLSADEALETPFLLVGTEDEIARQIVDSRERYGFTAFYVQRPYMTEFGPCIKKARALA